MAALNTTVELNKEQHQRLKELAKHSGMKIKKIVNYSMDYGMKKFIAEFARLLDEDLRPEIKK